MDIHWLEQSEGDVPVGDEWLSGEERGRLAALHIPKRRADWRLGRWTAKCAVCAYLKMPRHPGFLAAVELRPAPGGAPEVFLRGRPAAVALSLSHSRGVGWCVVAPAGAEVGCDIEAIEPRSVAFLGDYFTDEEQALAAQTPAAERDQLVTLLWSAKESALKAMGCGLRADTRSVNAAPAGERSGPTWSGVLCSFIELQGFPDHIGPVRAGPWHRLSAAHGGGRVFQGWWREAGGLVRTAVADPVPLRFLALPIMERCP